MDIAQELNKKLGATQYDMVSYLIEKASVAYDDKNYSKARTALKDAIEVLESTGESSAASKIRNFLSCSF